MKTNLKPKRMVIFAYVLVALVVLSAIIKVFLRWSNVFVLPTQDNAVALLIWEFLLPVIFSVMGGLIIVRQPGNRVGWLMLLPALAAILPSDMYFASLDGPPEMLTPWIWLFLWYDNWSWMTAIFPILLIPLHFPTGRPPTRRWEWVNWLAVGMWLIFITLIALYENIGPLEGSWKVPNPVGFIHLGAMEDTVFFVWGIGLLILVVASVASLFVRFRRAQADERQQIKWLLYAGVLFTAVYTASAFIDLDEMTPVEAFIDMLFAPSILAIGIAIAIAILRYRLYDIDLIIRRTLQYSLLTGILALTFFGSVVLLQSIFFRSERSEIIIVLSTLAIAAMFNPLRIRVQRFIDRRFYRKKYKAESVFAQFAAAARDEVDMDRLNAALLDAVSETMQPESLSLWLKEDVR